MAAVSGSTSTSRPSGPLRRRQAPLLAEGPAREPAAHTRTASTSRRTTSRRSPRWDAEGRAVARRSPSRPARVLLQDFTGVPVRRRPGRDARRDRRARRRPGEDQPARRRSSWSSTTRCRSTSFGTRRRRSRATPSSSSSATASATRSCAGARARSTNFAVVPPGHRHRPPGQPRVPRPRRLRATTTAARPTPTRSSAPTRTRRWSTASACSAGASAASRPRPRCSASRSRCSIPQVVGFKLTGELPEGATATDLVLTVTEMLRKHGVVGKFVEFYGAGLAAPAARRPRDDRQHVARSTARPARSSRSTPRRCATCGSPAAPSEQVALVEAYAKAQGLLHDAGRREPSYSEHARARPRRRSSRASPARSGRRTASPLDASVAGRRFDASALADARLASRRPRGAAAATTPAPSQLVTAPTAELDHGAVVIAAITSCTNTSNPSVMIAAGLLAKKAVERGLTPQAVGEDQPRARLARSSPTTSTRAGLTPYLEQLGFNLVGYGCTTCIGNSGPLPEEISQAIDDNDLVGRLGALGQPQLRGPHQPRRAR